MHLAIKENIWDYQRLKFQTPSTGITSALQWLKKKCKREFWFDWDHNWEYNLISDSTFLKRETQNSQNGYCIQFFLKCFCFYSLIKSKSFPSVAFSPFVEWLLCRQIQSNWLVDSAKIHFFWMESSWYWLFLIELSCKEKWDSCSVEILPSILILILNSFYLA